MTQAIAELNDACRNSIFAGTTVVMTPGIARRGDNWRIFDRVRTFNAFTRDNDPWGERDFGALDFKGEKILWKIDYFDRQLEFGSEDPADPAVTRRVLTVMLADEY